MIEQTQVDGRNATVVYMTTDFVPVDKDKATLIKAIFDDGGVSFYVPKPAKKVTKFNHNHDDKGRFGEGDGSGDVASSLYQRIEKDGGFTVHVGNLKAPEDGWMVSLENHEKAIPKTEFSKDAIQQYVQEHADALKAKSNFLGGWYNSDDGKVYLDVSQRFSGRKNAVAAARARHQHAVFNLKTKETMSVGAHKADTDEWLRKSTQSSPWHFVALDHNDVDGAVAAVQGMIEKADAE